MLELRFDFLPKWDGECDECHEPADTDAQTVVMKVGDHQALHFHRICAWKRATFIFGELF
jgi:hypothetical protein